ELLDPKWKGKISLQDPRQSAGNAHMSVLLKRFGEDFVRELLAKQAPAITKDARQQLEWTIRNNYPIGIAVDETEVHSMQAQGLPFNVKPVLDAASLSTGAGGVNIINRAPHPNAAKVFVNWLLSRDTQAKVASITKSNSRRLDVPPVDPSSAADPAHIDDYLPFANQREDFLPYKQQMLKLSNELIK
ncbi:MAG TPA: ABC transporter substrate-binding protein, partial [Chloroflexota bacterium]|nr:ABC transporter substrate-binding protein [Chloroflexota bacterium]